MEHAERPKDTKTTNGNDYGDDRFIYHLGILSWREDLEILKAQMQRTFFDVMVDDQYDVILTWIAYRDVLHPNRANVSKDELREKLAELYKANKDQVSVFGFRTQYGGGKSTGFALIYDSHEALKKFEPHYRLVRIGAATKVEKASRQQRMFLSHRPLAPWGLDQTCIHAFHISGGYSF